ncbi:MAG: DUF4238 domain-containing protein [Sphingosinicella sp.]|nr:DUF4238 domain-containing protein [Sphingosinicella sp.]
MSSVPKRHHWWPVCHSSLWVDAEGCVTTMTATGAVLRTRPLNTAVIGHYNSVRLPDGNRDASLEIFFADQVEGPVAPILARLGVETRRDYQLESGFDKQALRRDWKGIKQDGFVPDERAFSAAFSATDRRLLAYYVASLMVRVPSYKDELNSSRMLGMVAAVLGIPADSARFETDSLHVEIVRRHLEDYAQSLETCAFILIDAPEGDEFLIGDTPVIPAALGFGEAEVMCPITPSRALMIISGWRPTFTDRIAIFRARRKSIRSFNKTMLQNAEREVFCRTPVSLAYVAKHLGTRQVRLVPNMETALHGHIAKGPMLIRQHHTKKGYG